jgi:hypothetical protein
MIAEPHVQERRTRELPVHRPRLRKLAEAWALEARHELQLQADQIEEATQAFREALSERNALKRRAAEADLISAHAVPPPGIPYLRQRIFICATQTSVGIAR